MIAAPVLLFLVYFFYWPLSHLITVAFDSPESEWVDLYNNPLIKRFLVFTFVQAILTVLGALLIGFPTGYLLSRTNPFGLKFLRSAITVPFLFPPLAILLGFVVLFEPRGLISNFAGSLWVYSPFSFWGIILAHVMFNVSVVARIVEASLNDESANHHDLAQTLGASRWMRFRTITLVHLGPSIESAILLVFLYAFNSFAIVLILGQVRYQTIEVMIYTQSKLRLNYEAASILALLQLLINITIIALYTRRRTFRSFKVTINPIIRNENRKSSTIILWMITILTWFPILIVISKTFEGLMSSPDTIKNQIISGSYDRYLGTSPLRVMENTLLFGLLVAIITVIFSFLLILSLNTINNPEKMEKLYILLTLIPMGTSAITLSFALLSTHGTDESFTKNVWLFIISAQIIAALPFSTRILFSSWQRVPTDLLLVSKTLGASPLHSFRKIIFPLMKSTILVAFLFSFAISIGEFGATYFLVRGEWLTLSLAIHRLFSSRTTLLPNLYATILALTALISFWIIEKFGSIEMKL